MRAPRAITDDFPTLWAINWLLLIGIFRLTGRSTDYLTGDIFTVGIVEIGSDVPQIVWGIACLVSAVTIAVGMWLRHFKLQATGCLLAGSTNAGFAAITAGKAFEWVSLSQADGSFAPFAHWVAEHIVDVHAVVPVDDWRFPTDYLAAALQWAVLGVALIMIDAVMKDRKREEEHGLD